MEYCMRIGWSQQLAGGIEQMHRDDANGAAGPRGGREAHSREGERLGRTAPARRRPARVPSLRGIHVSPCRTPRAGAGLGGVRRPGQPHRPDGTKAPLGSVRSDQHRP